MASFKQGARKPYSRPSRGNMDGQWQHDKFPGESQRKSFGLSNGAVAAPAAALNTKLKVSNLHYEVTPKDLSAIFGQIGTLVREPLLWYDESGRSTGTALVSFETATEATRAKKQFDGILAKGQPMSIAYDTRPPRAPRRAASAPSTMSLLNRIEKPALIERMSRDDTAAAKPSKASGPGKGRVGPIRAKIGRAEGKGKSKADKQPKTAEELDKELDAFMGDAEPTSEAALASPAAALTAQDVDMA